MSVYTYTPEHVTLTVAGHLVTGWDSFTITRTSPGFRRIAGIRGKGTRVRNKDSSATLAVELQQTSPSNTVFSQIHQLDLSQGTGRLEITLRDADGDYVFQTNTGYISGYPESGFGSDIQNRTWIIICEASTLFVGGNENQGIDLFERAKEAVSGLI